MGGLESSIGDKRSLIQVSGEEWVGMVPGVWQRGGERAGEEPGVRGGPGILGEERGEELRGVGCRSL